MTMREGDESGASYVRPSVFDEPRGRTRVLLLLTVALASLTVNVIGGLLLMWGGVG